MNIRNNMNQGLRTKILKCIELLDIEYKSLNFTIDPYPARERLEHERKNNNPELTQEQYETILNSKKTISGLLLKDKKKIKIFLFNFKDLDTDPNEVIDLIGNIYHEIRHAWQYENNLFQDDEGIDTLDDNLEFYFSQESEKDAYRFQLEQMQKNGNKILEIFNINKRIIGDFKLKDEIMELIN